MRLAPVIDTITVDSPELLLTHLGDRRYDIDKILDKLKPLPKPLALDITGKVRELKLPALSLHAVKYSDHGIKRCKLSDDVNYVVLLHAQLTARNKMVINQLSFGDKVAGSTASLPVKVAVALLADRNGVIDLDLPFGGSLNDPRFSLGTLAAEGVKANMGPSDGQVFDDFAAHSGAILHPVALGA